MHRGLVCGDDLQAAQQRHPIRVVPFGRVRQLAELGISREKAVLGRNLLEARFEFLRKRQRPQHSRSRLAVGKTRRIMSQSLFVWETAQQEFVRLLDKTVISIESLERGILSRAVALSRSAFLPASAPSAELRRGHQAQQEGLSISPRLELTD